MDHITPPSFIHQLHFIYFMKRKSLDQFDEQGTQVYTNHTNIYIPTNNLTTFNSLQFCGSLHFQDSSKECRICFQQIQDVAHNFISPCKCTGSLRFVHQQCFMTWIERVYCSKGPNQQKIMKANGLPCQICKERVYLNFNNVLTCLTREEISNKIQSNLAIFVILIIFKIITMGSIAFIIFFMQDSRQSFGRNTVATIVVVCALAFLVTAVSLSFYYLITRFCIETKNRLQSFKNQKKVRKIRNKRKVMPVPMP